jgi:hypothetical protein
MLASLWIIRQAQRTECSDDKLLRWLAATTFRTCAPYFCSDENPTAICGHSSILAIATCKQNAV